MTAKTKKPKGKKTTKRTRVVRKPTLIPQDKRITNPAELRALGFYFTVSNAGQTYEGDDAFVAACATTSAWGHVSVRMHGRLQDMCADASTVEDDSGRPMTPDRMFNDLLKEARSWERLAARGDAYVTNEWRRMCAGKKRTYTP